MTHEVEGLTAIPVIALRPDLLGGAPVASSQRRMVLSMEPETARRLSGLMATL